MNRNLVYIILTLVVGILIAIYFYIPFMEKPKTLFTKTKIAIDPTILGSKTDPTLNKDKYKALEPEKALEHYKQWAIYPPFSRPLYKEQLELIEPYSIHLQEVEPIQPQTEGCKKDPEGKCIQENLTVQELKCILKPERSIYIGDIKIKVELYCSEKQQNLEVLQINPQVYTIKIGDKKLNSTASIAFGDDGENGDGKAEDKVYTFLISPTGEDWGQMFLEVDMEVNGKPMNYKASWYYTPHIVAEFQKSTKDSLKDGHLLVSIPITISKEGRYFLRQTYNLQEKASNSLLPVLLKTICN